MIFQCNRCLKYFSTKYHYNNHLGRKIQCKENINKIIDQIENTILEEDKRFPNVAER
jgi:hypothetical protein